MSTSKQTPGERKPKWYEREVPVWLYWFPDGFIAMLALVALVIWGLVAGGPTLWMIIATPVVLAVILRRLCIFEEDAVDGVRGEDNES